ncbi:phospholipid-transporting ATPase ABCA3-like [Homalodisca vitripennis]|uniref:phospholipid-transporting ATPase ABCA3-like n=1 Tax=Homalodisca vitripennis TaxID=197043 RepID=UPI001EEC1FC1|nr:phospholipid-transporting ATPase ABCA3-like [Homalodisca vitripennis]
MLTTSPFGFCSCCLFLLIHHLFFCISTFFTNGTIAIIIGVILWYIGTIYLNIIFVTSPSKHGLFLNTLSCLWPSIALQWSIDVINDFHKSGHKWTMSSLFDSGTRGDRVSVGLASTMLVVDVILYNLITWYMENINPGPYGQTKPPGFIFQQLEVEPQKATTTRGAGCDGGQLRSNLS